MKRKQAMKRTNWMAMVGALAAAGTLASAQECALAQGGALGMVIAIKGSPSLVSAGKASKLRLGVRLAGGSVVRCPPGSEATVVLFQRGERYRIPSGTDVTISSAMSRSSASKLPPTGAASRDVALALSGSRTGAVNSRGGSKILADVSSFGAFTTLDRNPDQGAGSRPEFGFLAEGTRSLSWSDEKAGSRAGTEGTVAWTLYDKSSNIVHHTRATSQTGGQMRVQIPAEVALVPGRPYVWRAVAYRGASTSSPTAARWGVVTWLSRAEVRQLAPLLPDASVSAAADLARTDPERALILSGKLRDFEVAGGAWSLLQGLRNTNVPGAEDAFFEFYGELPAMAQLFGAQIPAYFKQEDAPAQ